MICNKAVPSHLDICDACFDEQKNQRGCRVCGALTMSPTGACLNPDCRRNDYKLRDPRPPKVRNPGKLALVRES
jgi:hypothetical protein